MSQRYTKTTVEHAGTLVYHVCQKGFQNSFVFTFCFRRVREIPRVPVLYSLIEIIVW